MVEVIKNILAGNVKGMYIMGENPAMSDPDAEHARDALAKLEMLVVQDIFLTETAYLADVILPASSFAEKTGTFTNTDRYVQLGRQALNPPGKARQDLEIIIDLARQLGLSWSYGTGEQAVAAVFDEMRHTMPSIGGITWERLQKEDSVTYPCEKEGDPGDSVVFIKSFPTPTGKAKFVPADIIPADERPDTEYPMVLITGRQLEHWHTGSMTRRSGVLDALEPDPVAMLESGGYGALGAKPGQVITIQSRRGKVSLYARDDESSPHGAVFVPFCFYEAAINKLTNSALDPFAKIPEFKYCAVRVTLGRPAPGAVEFRRRSDSRARHGRRGLICNSANSARVLAFANAAASSNMTFAPRFCAANKPVLRSPLSIKARRLSRSAVFIRQNTGCARSSPASRV